MKCQHCSAPIPEDASQCVYCGCQHDVDLQSVHQYTTEQPPEERICPHCNIAMETLNLENESVFLIERCHACMGLFFDPNELEALLEKSVAHVHNIDYAQLDKNTNRQQRLQGIHKKVRWVKCPVCRQFMNRKSFGIRSGVVVDRCRNHGVWLEHTEFRRLLEWKKAGGSILQTRKARLQDARSSKGGLLTKQHHSSERSLLSFLTDIIR